MDKNQISRSWLAHGIVLELQSNRLEILEKVENALLLPGWTPGNNGPKRLRFRIHDLEADGCQFFEEEILWAHYPDHASFVKGSTATIHHRLATYSDQLFIHAASLEWQGKALLLPGRSHSGKSSLCAELVRLGAGYLSDEYAVINPRDCRVSPFPRLPQLRDNRTFPGSPPIKGTLKVGTILFLKFREEQTGLDLQRMSVGQAGLGLSENLVAAKRLLATNLQHLAAIAGEAQCYHGTRGPAESVAHQILKMAEKG